MKTRRIKIGIRRPEVSLHEAEEVARRLKAGEKLPEQEEALYFTDLATLRRALSLKRLAPLWAILEHKPRSVRAVSRTGRPRHQECQPRPRLSCPFGACRDERIPSRGLTGATAPLRRD
jgi:predicted transcriptional regulator